MDLGMIGPGIALGLSAMGSAIGCAIAGMASHGVMSHVEEGHGKFIAVSAMPSSQVIYGFILMLQMKRAILIGSTSALAALGIAIPVGLAIMASAIYQGKLVATAIQASAKQPSIFGKTIASPGIVESFALFAFVFSLLIL